MKIYKFTTWEPESQTDETIHFYTKENLINNQLYFNSVTKFNDPFDLYPVFYFKGTKEELLHAAENIALFYEPNLKGKTLKQKAREYMSDMGLTTLSGRTETLNRAKKTIQSNGVCCFTLNDPTNILMWSHYANKHTGICLEFELPEREALFITPPRELLNLQQVIYEETRPTVNVLDFPLKPSHDHIWELAQRCLLTKSIKWKYENEYRCILTSKTGAEKYNPAYLTSIYAGQNMQEDSWENLLYTVKHLDTKVNLYRMELNNTHFALNSKSISYQ